ncbi:DNA replication licensing factor mcm7 [Phtheirospermum japonicum]|uniref:DNA replication licensing factor mcm7 n=1 Tax=Phtheirospermum japonicum TaxID=374723 RepID=A0A830B414_9LAMI|nr:DNA replication licensing factor mcm7 [Phtheirospermum japonicum]
MWLALSLLIGLFAPTSLTAGDISVGVGPPLKKIPEISTETIEKLSRKSIRSLKKASDGNLQKYTAIDDGPVVDFAEKMHSDRYSYNYFLNFLNAEIAKDFLTNFMDPNGEAKYVKILQDVTNRKIKAIQIEIEDLINELLSTKDRAIEGRFSVKSQL